MRDTSQLAVSIRLSPARIDEVIRATANSGAPNLAALLAGAPAASPMAGETVDRRLSRSLLRGLSLLGCFESRGEKRGIVELAGELGMSPSTAHRYALTLVELGLLERSPRTRKYSPVDGS